MELCPQERCLGPNPRYREYDLIWDTIVFVEVIKLKLGPTGLGLALSYMTAIL